MYFLFLSYSPTTFKTSTRNNNIKIISQNIRIAASKCISESNSSYRPPIINWISYIRTCNPKSVRTLILLLLNHKFTIDIISTPQTAQIPHIRDTPKYLQLINAAIMSKIKNKRDNWRNIGCFVMST